MVGDRLDIGAVLADDQTSYLIFGQQEKYLSWEKVKYNVVTNERTNILKIKEIVVLLTRNVSLRLRNHSSTGRRSVFWLLPTKKGPKNVQSDRRIN